jgi:hypothetical protein
MKILIKILYFILKPYRWIRYRIELKRKLKELRKNDPFTYTLW